MMDGAALSAAERYARVERLAQLKADGTLTEEEFAAEKAKLLHHERPAPPPVSAAPFDIPGSGSSSGSHWLWIVPVALIAAGAIVATVVDMTRLKPPPSTAAVHRRTAETPASVPEPAAVVDQAVQVEPSPASSAAQVNAADTMPDPAPASVGAAKLTISPADSKPAVTDADWVQMVPAPDSTNTDHNCDRPVLLSQVTSLNGGYVYQRVCHWVVSDDIIQVRLADGRRKRVTPGNTLAVIRDGPYRGYLLVAKHKYRPNMGGSYDPTYVVRPDGHEELAVPGTEDGDSEKTVSDWLAQHGWHAS